MASGHNESLSENIRLPGLFFHIWGADIVVTERIGDGVDTGKQACVVRKMKKKSEEVWEHSFRLKQLGKTAWEKEEYEEAMGYFTEAVALIPEDHEAHFGLGIVFMRMDKPEEAARYFENALSLQPDYVDAMDNLGAFYAEKGCFAQAERLHSKAVKLAPGRASAWNNLGIECWHLGNLDYALNCFKKALSLAPDDSRVHTNLGGLFREMGKIKDSMIHLEMALKIEPDDPVTLNNLANAHLVVCEHAKASELYRRAIRCDPQYLEARSNFLLALHYDGTLSPEEIFDEHLRCAENYRKIAAPGHDTFKNIQDPGRRLRIGYISGDFRRHSVACFIEPVIMNHNAKEVDILIYSDVLAPDEVTERFWHAAGTGCRDISAMDPEQVADLIRYDRVDILVDLSGHTARNRLTVLARKPAPVQITYLGYPDTTGLDTVDYRITDCKVDPQGKSDNFHTERLWRLPGGFLCYKPDKNAPLPSEPPVLQHDFVTFGSFNMSSKINSEVIGLWARILMAVPDSRLMLKATAFGDDYVRKSLGDAFAVHGIARDRIIFMGLVTDFSDHLACYNSIDIALDPFPYNGTTTTLEALWMGRPVITLAGDTHASRVGASILSHIGLTEYIACSQDEYVKCAVRLACTTEELKVLSGGLRERVKVSGLVDAPGFTRKMEHAYRSMWEDWCEREGGISPVRIKIRGGLTVVVPDSLDLMTPYILTEQRGWFEQEWEFVKKVVEPGDCCLDIGANYGLYTLVMARLTGEEGLVLAIEPSPDTAAHLRMSITENNLGNVRIQEAALSDHDGWGRLNINAELNSLSAVHHDSDGQEPVPLLTLTACLARHNIKDAAFIKLDAEGEESRILDGSRDFFARSSPLVMYELKHGEELNSELVTQFESMGYSSYYLIPGLDLLSPFSLKTGPDDFLLNLFACKPDRAAMLEKCGLLAATWDESAHDSALLQSDLLELWDSMPYSRDLVKLWASIKWHDRPDHERYLDALKLYRESMKNASSYTPAQRLTMLHRSFEGLMAIVNDIPSFPRLMSLSRVAKDIGQRRYAVNILNILFDTFSGEGRISLDEEFLAVSDRYERICPEDRLGEWCMASILEERELLRIFSTYFDPTPDMKIYELFNELGFSSSNMKRRKKLIDLRMRK